MKFLAIVLVVACVCSSEKCNKVYKSESCSFGIITSPRFPLPYPNGTICTYEFIANGSERIQLNFIEFSLNYSDNYECYYSDTIEIFMFINNKYRPVQILCGSRLPGLIMSYGEKMKIEFRGINGGNSIGFKMEFKFLRNYGIKTGQQIGDKCDFHYNSSISRSGTFTSPNYPGIYPMNIICNYFFYGYDDERVLINFTYFDVEGVYPCDEEVSSDSVEFSNYKSRDRLFKFYCGRLIKSFNVTSDGKFFRVTFRSNTVMDGTGFSANYYFLKPKTQRVILNFEPVSTAVKVFVNFQIFLIFFVYVFK
ncbi:hypothetical protein PVAND_015080 [Polypedilum vanderplanki]|uniref:CUB domain-containing protein n=1 Tax=Polypedilum vanderplanki TaxID=319348 RepID=A0A9J6BB24_POLVA|nr:hypothetical protein PVAND_015080 [Polypedilum vanderplanki]